MFPKRFLALLWCVFLGLCGCAIPWARAVESAPSFTIAGPSAWVRPFSPEDVGKADTDGGGIDYVLVDQQGNLEPRASFYHEARRITSESGVQNGSAITVSFDPSYQKLIFHFIRIIRGDTAAERLDRSQVKVFQRERDLEAFLYDGSFSANCQLEDVRVGDVIEYAYTVEGANPVMKGKYFADFTMEWSVPVHHAITRIIRPAARQLHYRIKNRAREPVVSTQKGATEWLWEESDIPARQLEPRTPRGYYPYGLVQVSEFADWQAVADWAVPLYEVDEKPSPDLEGEIARLRALPGDEERILAALRFVQEEVRYLGIESGVGSHQPTAPGEVLRRRFGDCKDKSLLLATLLRKCGIAATPALVSSVLRSQLAERQPSPGALNHVILQVEAGKNVWWLDATRSSQRGPLSQIHVGNFGHALVLRPGTLGLTAFAPPPDSFPKRIIVENYSIPVPGGEGKLEVLSEHRGLSAENTRAFFKANTVENIQKNYLEYYARRFPRIRPTGRVEYQEMPGETGCQVKEHYIIPEIWRLNDDKTQHVLALYPADVDADMGTPGSAQRSDPLALNHPVNTAQEIHAEMFEPWSMKTDQRDVSNAFFRFQHESKVTGRQIQMSYSFQSLAEQVSAADLPAYDTALRTLKDTLGYSFTYSTPEQVKAANLKNPNSGRGEFNWPIAVLLAAILAVVIPWTIRYARASKLASPLPPSLTHPALEGIGGWLLLVALAHLIRPFSFILANRQIFSSVFSVETWRKLTQVGQPAFHPYWMPTLLFELIYNSISFVLCGLLLFLFFKKRAVWPRWFVGVFIFHFAGIAVDTALAMQIPAAAANLGDSGKEIARLVFSAFIWIPYALTSKRVKATFRY